MIKNKLIPGKWHKLGISLKFKLAFGVLLSLIALVSVTGYGALTIVYNKTESAILNSTEIRRLILEMNSHLEVSRRLEREFFLKYPVMGFSQAKKKYADSAKDHIDKVISLSLELKKRIFESNVSNKLKESDVSLKFYLSASQRYSKSFQEAVNLVSKLASEKTGFKRQLADYSTRFLQTLDTKINPELLKLYQEMKLYEKEYFLSKKRPFMQSAFNTAFLLKKAIKNNVYKERPQRIQSLEYLESYTYTAGRILVLDVELLRKTREFDIQADAIDPIADKLTNLAHEEVEHARNQILKIKNFAGIFLLLITLTGLFLTIIIAGVFNRSITVNIIRLTRFARVFQAGNTKIYASISSQDELGQLAKVFNVMAHRINNLISGLENKVLERTAELQKTNSLLKQEVSERKKAEQDMKAAKEEAEQANRTKSEFLANMSHEIRTPLNSILGFTEILEKQIRNKQQIKYLTAITSGGNTLLTLINDILDLSKIEAGKLKLEYSVIGIYSIFKEIEQIFSQKTAEKGLRFIIEMDENLPQSIIMDGIRLRQVLLNLVGNAVKFTESGYIKIISRAVYPENDHSSFKLIISVEDTGIGISKKDQKSIFDAFIQQTGQNQGQYGGTGLGLSITKRLVRMMGGNIVLKSEINKGSTFIVTIEEVEVASVSREIEQETQCMDIDHIQLDINILIVDDIYNNRQLLKGYLLPHKLGIIEAVNGLEAVKMAEKYCPDIILMDIKMPVMDGYEAIERIRSSNTLPYIPIIAVTAAAMKDSEKRIRGLCDAYLRKPVSRQDLIKEIAGFFIEEEPGKQDIENLCQDNINNIDLLINKLQDNLYNTWKELKETLSINDIEEFAVQVKETGRSFGWIPLTQWAEKLESQAAIFDVDALQETLEGYIDIINKLKILNK